MKFLLWEIQKINKKKEISEECLGMFESLTRVDGSIIKRIEVLETQGNKNTLALQAHRNHLDKTKEAVDLVDRDLVDIEKAVKFILGEKGKKQLSDFKKLDVKTTNV